MTQDPYEWSFLSSDRALAEELTSFLPEKIWDSHAHIYRAAHLNSAHEGLWFGGPPDVSIDVWRKHCAALTPNASVEGGLFFPAPLPNADIRKSNDYLLEELDRNPNARGLLLVTPEMSCGEISEQWRHPQVKGLKPYHVYSRYKPTAHSSISDFFPRSWWRWADDNDAVVMLHIMKDKAIAAPQNIDEIRAMCSEFPGMKVILAHAGRCFHAFNADAMQKLSDIPNLWFDMSGVCEPHPMESVLEYFGPQKLLWGSDFPIAMLRGKAVTLGDGFFWLDGASSEWGKALATPTLVGIESLRALKRAAHVHGLSKEDVSSIFYANGRRLLGIESSTAGATQALYRDARNRISGDVGLVSKHPDRFAPGVWPAYFQSARGCEVWDLDGTHYYDMSTNSVGACLLGYSNPAVNRDVLRCVNSGNISTLNAPEDVDLARELCSIHPWAEQARFVRGGGEACATAVRIARATTGRSKVAVCGYHGWHDWYLAANLGTTDALDGHLLPGLSPEGVPRELRGTTLTFRQNDTEAFDRIMDLHGDSLAAVVMEPCRTAHPDPGFLEHIRSTTQRLGVLLIFDEITVGWRLCLGGAHLMYGIDPDIAIFAKATSNGYPMGAIIGHSAAMKGANHSFVSSTYWSERIGPSAALATIREMKKIDLPGHVKELGQRVQQCWLNQAAATELEVVVAGFPCLATFSFQHTKSAVLMTMFTQMMLQKGFLAGGAFYPTLAHNDLVIDRYITAVASSFREIKAALETGELEKWNEDMTAAPPFARLL